MFPGAEGIHRDVSNEINKAQGSRPYSLAAMTKFSDNMLTLHLVRLLGYSTFTTPCFALLCFALRCFALLTFALLSFALLCSPLLCLAFLSFAFLCFA
jgi:hypothetical protein